MLLMLVLVTMGILFSVVSQVSLIGKKVARVEGTSAALLQAKEALIGYAATYRDNPTHSTKVFGYLPCPDTTDIPQPSPPQGNGVTEGTCDSAGSTVVGLLPYKTLGLEDLRDSDGVCLWYVVSGTFKYSPETVPLNWDTQGQLQIVDTGGNILLTPNDSNGGAAAAIIAAGAPIAGQSRTPNGNNTCGAMPSEVAKYIESTISAGGTTILTQGTTGSTTNNDQILAITTNEIFSRIVARADFKNLQSSTPPGQINTLIDRISKALDKKVQDDILSAGVPTSGNSQPINSLSYTPQPAGAILGDIDSSMDISLANNNSYADYLLNWADQFRLLSCNSLSSPCLDINNNGVANCRGALVFSGSGSNGPRSSNQKTPSLANLSYYFESNGTTGARDLLTGSTHFAGSSIYDANIPTSDVATCLGYGGFGSLNQNASAFASGTKTPGGASTAVASVTTVSGTPTITLGGSSDFARAGCVWNANTLPLSSSLRLYFTYRIDSTGTGSTPRGFTLALADAATNYLAGNDPVMCGASGIARLGYAGAPPGTATVSSTRDISTFVWQTTSGGRALITTGSPHGFSVGNTVTIAGLSPLGYNGTYVINAVPSTTQFRYALPTNPGAAYMGILPPKVGIEFDMVRDLTNDPGSSPTPANDHHFAFIYWGGRADNDPTASTRNGNDDNTHNMGVTADGGSPLNPRNLSVTSASVRAVNNVAAARWDSVTSRAIITTSAPHGYTSGQTVTISDITALAYKRTVTITVIDSTHFYYSVGSNPGLYPYVATVTSANWSSGLATIVTSAAHGLSTGQYVMLSGISPAAWNGTYQITVINSTQFTLSIATNPGVYSPSGFVSAPLSFISSATWSATTGKVTITSSSAHNLTNNQYVTISGVSPASYNGTYRIGRINNTQFSLSLASNPGIYTPGTSGGSIAPAGATSTVMASPVTSSTISSIIWATNAATVTTSTAHGFSNGQMVNISDVYPGSYNGKYVISVIDSTHFTYTLDTNPTANFSGSTFANPGIATVKVSDTYLPYSKTPADTTIHVRLDIDRHYDESIHQSKLTLRAYIGNIFVASNCQLSDFQNFSRDLSELCPSRTPTIAQDGITINDVAGPALANIYLGFTTARSAAAGDDQVINIQGLIYRNQ